RAAHHGGDPRRHGPGQGPAEAFRPQLIPSCRVVETRHEAGRGAHPPAGAPLLSSTSAPEPRRGQPARQEGPNSTFRSPNSAGSGLTRCRSSRSTVVLVGPWSLIRTSLSPLWWERISQSLLTSGGVLLCDGNGSSAAACGATCD